MLLNKFEVKISSQTIETKDKSAPIFIPQGRKTKFSQLCLPLDWNMC